MLNPCLGFPGGISDNLLANGGDIRDSDSIPGSERSPGRGHGNTLQYSCLENLIDRGAWQAKSMGLRELDVTEATCHTCTHYYTHGPT